MIFILFNFMNFFVKVVENEVYFLLVLWIFFILFFVFFYNVLCYVCLVMFSSFGKIIL